MFLLSSPTLFFLLIILFKILCISMCVQVWWVHVSTGIFWSQKKVWDHLEPEERWLWAGWCRCQDQISRFPTRTANILNWQSLQPHNSTYLFCSLMIFHIALSPQTNHLLQSLLTSSIHSCFLFCGCGSLNEYFPPGVIVVKTVVEHLGGVAFLESHLMGLEDL